jgi:GSCFA family protein
MSTFRTTIPKIFFPFTFSHKLPTLCIGSCFSENIGHKLDQGKFPVLINPFGIQYNPHSIGNTLEYLLNEHLFSEKDLFKLNGLWHSFDHHGHFSKPDLSVAIQRINETLQTGSTFLKKTKRLVLTFGTSNVFIYKKTQQIVANCHKVPNQEFERNTLTIDSIIEKLYPIFIQLKSKNSDLEILLTVSPIRHIRDGLIENQQSKARLLLACEQLCQTLDFIHYFPSYEIMMDDLRDYRFYATDMIHPNELSIDYIWQYFSQCLFNEETKDLNSKISKISSAANHRPFHPESSVHQDFVTKQIQIIQQIQTKYDFLNFEQEKTKLLSHKD